MSGERMSVGSLRIRLLPIYPLSVMLGGLEHQCVETCKSLQELNAPAQFLHWFDSFVEF